MKKFIFYIMVVIGLWFTSHVIFTTIDGLRDELHPADICIVLGNKVEPNGQVSKRLQGRLDRAIELYENQYFNYIIVSGGLGKEGFDEAKVMKEYLVKKGVPKNKIFVDSKGNNTLMTAENSKILMDKMNLNSLMIVSQFYHISRTKITFKKLGFKQIYSAHAKYFEFRDLYSLFREVPAYYKYLLKDF